MMEEGLDERKRKFEAQGISINIYITAGNPSDKIIGLSEQYVLWFTLELYSPHAAFRIESERQFLKFPSTI